MINPFKEINWRPDRAELKKFAWSLIIGFPIIALIFFLGAAAFNRSFPSPRFFLLLGGIGSGIGILCKLIPAIAPPFYKLWYGFAACIGIVMANLIFTMLYYFVFAPLGLFMRLIGRDPLCLKKQKNAGSYWKDAPPAPPAQNYFKQY